MFDLICSSVYSLQVKLHISRPSSALKASLHLTANILLRQMAWGGGGGRCVPKSSKADVRCRLLRMSPAQLLVAMLKSRPDGAFELHALVSSVYTFQTSGEGQPGGAGRGGSYGGRQGTGTCRPPEPPTPAKLSELNLYLSTHFKAWLDLRPSKLQDPLKAGRVCRLWHWVLSACGHKHKLEK